MWHDPEHEPAFSEYLELDLSDVVPSIAGPKRPQDRIVLSEAKSAFRKTFPTTSATTPARGTTRSSTRRSTRRSRPATRVSCRTASPTTAPPPCSRPPTTAKGRASKPVTVKSDERGEFVLDHGAVVVAAITSCTNTSNPEVMLGAALLARNAVEKGLTSKPWVKTTMAPGSQVVTDYYDKAGLWPYLEKLGFYLVGYGCTTCIGNTGPLPDEISKAINDNDLSVTAVLSGNRNFEGRINPDVKMNYLASPPLVIAYALAGTMDFDFESEPLGTGQGRQRRLPQGHLAVRRRTSRTPSPRRSTRRCSSTTTPTSSRATSAGATCRPRAATPSSGTRTRPTCASRRTSTACPPSPQPVTDITGARVLALLGDSVTTDHISPAGSIKPGTPAAQYLDEHGVRAQGLQLLRFAARQPRGDDPRHVRQHPAAQPAARRRLGRLHPRLHPGRRSAGVHLRRGAELCGTRHSAGGAGRQGVRLRLVARLGGQGHEAAGRPGGDHRVVRAHPPLQPDRHGRHPAAVPGGRVGGVVGPGRHRGVRHHRHRGAQQRQDAEDGARQGRQRWTGQAVEFDAVVRIDTPGEADYYRNGGILQYVLRNMLRSS